MKQTRHPLFWRWIGMMNRCYKKRAESFKNYGARGITVCKRWHDFSNFAEDMLPSYKEGLTLERKNNSLGYYKRNCKWATRSEQARNTRANRNIMTPWGFMCFSDAHKKAGLSYGALNARTKRWPKRMWFLPINSTARYAKK